MVGYATLYTMAPVFSLVLDRDVNEDVALLYPELYKELTKVCHFSVCRRRRFLHALGLLNLKDTVLNLPRRDGTCRTRLFSPGS